MKKNISYYPHHTESDQHAKFKMLRVEYGWSGEGKFWALNNRIAKAENCCLDVSKKYNKAAIASDLDFSLNEFDSFILFLTEDCELIRECGKGLITNDIVQEAFDKVMRDRGAARARSKRTSGEKSKTSGEKTYKVKERKVKESKEEKTIVGQEPRPPRSKPQIPIKEIIDFFNDKAGKSFKHTSKVTQSHIRARWAEGFNLSDFKEVIKEKVFEWSNDPNMEQYLRPTTLFGTKFESYLQASKESRPAAKLKWVK